jgi:hypothetical protein
LPNPNCTTSRNRSSINRSRAAPGHSPMFPAAPRVCRDGCSPSQALKPGPMRNLPKLHSRVRSPLRRIAKKLTNSSMLHRAKTSHPNRR